MPIDAVGDVPYGVISITPSAVWYLRDQLDHLLHDRHSIATVARCHHVETDADSHADRLRDRYAVARYHLCRACLVRYESTAVLVDRLRLLEVTLCDYRLAVSKWDRRIAHYRLADSVEFDEGE